MMFKSSWSFSRKLFLITEREKVTIWRVLHVNLNINKTQVKIRVPEEWGGEREREAVYKTIYICIGWNRGRRGIISECI